MAEKKTSEQIQEQFERNAIKDEEGLERARIEASLLSNAAVGIAVAGIATPVITYNIGDGKVSFGAIAIVVGVCLAITVMLYVGAIVVIQNVFEGRRRNEKGA